MYVFSSFDTKYVLVLIPTQKLFECKKDFGRGTRTPFPWHCLGLQSKEQSNTNIHFGNPQNLLNSKTFIQIEIDKT